MVLDILIVDDEDDIRTLVADLLKDEGYETRKAKDADSALASVRSLTPSLVLLDIWLQDSSMDGLQILKELMLTHPELPVIMMSGHGTIETAVVAIKEGAYDFIEKPFKTDRILLSITRAIEAARLRQENTELRMHAGPATEIIGISPAINQLRQVLEQVAPTNSRVLIKGPAGSGKELVARLLHTHSTRHNGPFVILNCANMDPTRVEGELFGSEEIKDYPRIGTFERAHMGTLLLDEVTDMPIETQGKIVRALQDQTFQRIGSTNRVKVDVRVVASTIRNLADAVAKGRVREDLFYRLNVVPIDVPPLKQRREDIPLLAEYFMVHAAQTNGRAQRLFSKDALVAMQSYSWPGNVRELRNIVERLLILAPGDSSEPVNADMLPNEISESTSIGKDLGKASKAMEVPLREAREIFEREYLSIQMSRFSGNISHTASFVGMERSALHRKLKTLGINSKNTNRENAK